MKIAVCSSEAPPYGAAHEDGIIAQALAILHARIKRGPVMDSPQVVRQFLICHAAKSPHTEVFAVMFLDNQNALIECRDMFSGTLAACNVYPREVVRAALELHASAVILSHNHPSGTTDPSRADKALTNRIRDALDLVDVRTLDHIITSGGNSASMAELGLM